MQQIFSFPEQRRNDRVDEILILCEVHFFWNRRANRFWGDVLKKSLSFCFKTNLICFKKNESSHSDPESRLSNHPFFLRPFMGFIASVPAGPWIPGTKTELLAKIWMSGPDRWNLFLLGQIDYVAVQCLRRWRKRTVKKIKIKNSFWSLNQIYVKKSIMNFAHFNLFGNYRTF